MNPSAFVHLHVHTHYSLLDGANKVPDLVKRAKDLGMDSLAITDHGCLFGVIEFFEACKKEGIKPILGMEAYMAPGARTDRSTPTGNAGEAAYHLLLLAQDLEGYRNLVKLGSTAYREGFYYKPRIDKEILRELRKGLIATSSCLGGEIPTAILKHDMRAARQIAQTYADIFGPDNFFIEIQKQGIAEQDQANPELVELANKLGVGVVATNDVHFLRKEDHFAHDVLCCISMGKLITDQNRLKYPEELYLKSPAEMAQSLGQWPQALSNTVQIAQRCNVDLSFGKRYAPSFPVSRDLLKEEYSHRWPLGAHDDEKYLRQLCEEGLVWRYGTTDVAAEIRQRVEKELGVIANKKFCSYFLIVWDFCNFARSQGIPVGARGSGVSTMVGYLLGLCNVDPIRYGLLFERFMDPSRNEMPDIDIDICQEGRQKVLDYVRAKYGHVAQIITFGTLAAKAACKDVGRVLGVPLPDVDKLTKLIPGTPGMTLAKALAASPELRDLYQQNPTITRLVDVARQLEGVCRNAGCHAAGVVVADQPLDNVVPLYKSSDNVLMTQFEGVYVDKVGLLKIDFLGLRTLTTLQRAIDLEQQTRAPRGADPARPTPAPLLPDGRIDIERIDFADKNVLAMFGRGETRGIFQFESGGMQDLLMKMQPNRIEELIAANALYRPGPMELIGSYCARKHGREAVPKVHPVMDRLLAETYGIMVYQEDVMRIFNQLGGIELSSAYKLIKAISKKSHEVIARFKPDFIRGAQEKGIAARQAEGLFDLIEKFAGYGFNRAHSTRYAIVAFQTAYMKVYHPVEYMAALLTFEAGSTDKVVEYIEECRRMTLLDGSRGIKVLPPDVNLSDRDFTPVYVSGAGGGRAAGRVEGEIRFGLMAVRGIGEKAVEAILRERQARGPFRSLNDFCDRVDLRTVTRATVEALVKCGAFSSLGANRAQLLHILDRAVEMGQQAQQDRRMGQLGIFGSADPSGPRTLPEEPLPRLEELETAELLKLEKELLGFYLTSHPLTEHQTLIERYSTASTRDPLRLPADAEVVIGGMISRVSKKVAKSGPSQGQQWCIITIEDLEGQIDGMIWAEAYAQIVQRNPNLLAADEIVFVRGKVDKRRETPCIVVADVIALSEAVGRLTTSVLLELDHGRHRPEAMAQIKPLLAQHAGTIQVYAKVAMGSGPTVLLKLGPDCAVKPSRAMIDALDRVLGPGGVQVHGAGSMRIKRMRQERLFKGDGPEETPREAEIDAAVHESEDLV